MTLTFIFKMKKVYQIIILLVSLLYINSSTDPYCEDENVSKKSICHDQTVANSGEYCCYIKGKYKGETYTGCTSLSQAQKNDIDKTIDEIEDDDGGSITSLDCKSSFIELGLFSLIFLLL